MSDIFIRPSDVLIFRDGRPFSAGDDHRATGIFPPSPVAFYGALRSAAYAANGHALHASGLDGVSGELLREMGTPKTLGEMAITHFSLAHATPGKTLEPLYPLPADLLRLKSSDGAEKTTTNRTPKPPDWVRVKPDPFDRAAPQPLANWPLDTLRFLWNRNDERDWYAGATPFLTADGFASYLKGGVTPALFGPPDASDSKAVYSSEPRTSLEITNGTRTAEDGKLFEVDFTRPANDIGFALRLAHASSLGGARCIRLGGESRLATIESCTLPDLPHDVREHIVRGIKAENRCILVLTTPAVFKHGWRPDFIRPDGTGELGGCTLTLVGAALGRPLTIGGWDIVRNRPRPARKAVPAGSVYFFEVAEGEIGQLSKHTTGFSIYGSWEEEYRKQGLGHAYLGCY